jgi:hypothetical protein
MAGQVGIFDPEEEAIDAAGLPGTEIGDPMEDPWSEDADG